MNPPEVPAAAWDQLSRRYDRQLWLERAAVLAALELAAPRAADRLLDVGTGTGAVLRRLAAVPERPDLAVGIDRSVAMLARVPALPPGWSTRRGDVLELPFPAGTFHVVVVSYVLHILPEAVLAPALAQIARVLLPGGRLVTITPVIPARGLLRAAAAIGNGLAHLAPSALGGLRVLDPGAALEQAGFTLVRGRVIHRGYPSLCILARRPASAVEP